MFNREIRLKVVKKAKPETDKVDQTSHEIEGIAAHVAYTIDRVVKKVGIVMISYVVVDTARQILVAKAKQS